MRSKLKRGVSLLLSVVMAMSGAGNVITASAEELAEENAVVNETELLETEAPVYSITLPYYEECSYDFDKEHLREPVEEKKEIVLTYEADEKVEISLLPSGTLELGEVRLSDQEKHDILFEWKDENALEFFMPAKDIWLEAAFVTPATEMMQTEAATEIVQTELAYPETEQADEPAAEEETGDAGKSEIEVLPEESEQEPEIAGGDTAVEEETVMETEADGTEVPDAEVTESEEEVSYQEETDADGLPLQGSIVQVESITIPFDTWEFDQYSDFRNILYDTDVCTIEYISDDIIYDAAGTYSSIYRVTDKESGKFWFVLRPVVVSEKNAEEVVETEAQDIPVERETDLSEPTTESEELIESEGMTEVVTEESEEMESESVSEIEVIEEAESEQVSETEVSEPEFLMDAEVEPVMLLAEAEEEEADEDPVPDKFKLVVKGIYTAPSALKAGDASTTYKTVVFYEDDGSTVTRMAYCIQPKETSPGSGQTYDKDDIEILDDSTSKDKKMMKAMYYLYGGPAWNKSIEYADGSGSVNLKTVMTEAGCSSVSHYYTMTHYVLSYLYMNGSNWNYNSSESGVLNSSGVSLVKSVVSYLNKLPVPTTELTLSSLTATYADGISVSQTTTYKAIDENTAKIKLPDGVVLVNETAGESATGTVTISGGDKFHLEADASVEGSASYTLTCKYATDFTAMKLKLSGKQDIGFSYFSGDKTLSLSVEWPEIPKNKSIELQKYDSVTGQAVARGKGASFAGAEYTIYADAACTTAVEVMTTNADGYAKSSEIPIATYYVKETKAPVGYSMDGAVYTVEMSLTDEVEVYAVSSKESIIPEYIELQKKDKETGLTKPYNDLVSFAGAEYTIYADAACTERIEVLKTDANGYAKSSPLLVNTYYVKETKAPSGYLLDETVYTVDMNHTDAISVYAVGSPEQVLRKPIEVQKMDGETGLAQPQNSAVSFEGAEYTIYVDQNCSEQLEVLVTDKNGYAKSSDLPVGTYFVKETKAPVGYQLDTNLYTVTVGEDDKTVYRITSMEQVIRGSLSIMKFLDDSYEESILQDRVESGILSGICFVLKHEDQTVPTVKIVTDRYGYAATDADALVYGTWYITEDPETTPEGYEGITDVEIMVSEAETDLKYVVSNNQPAAQIKLVKKDAHTGNEVSISGGKFQILDSEGTAVTMPNPLNYAELTDTFTLDVNGMIYFTNALKAGKYQIKELEAPEGYLIGETLKFSVTENHDYLDPMVIEFEDEPQMGNIRIKKLDQDTEQMLGEGFAFEIYAAEDITDGSGAVRTIERDGKMVELKKGTLVTTVETGSDGCAETDNLYLGSYLVKESIAGEHYAISQKEYPVTLKANAKVTDVTVEVQVKNEKTKLELLKVDASEEETVLEGIRFRIYSSSDVEAEKARQVAEAVEELRISQNPEREAFLAQQSEALAYFDAEQHLEEEREQFLAVQAKELEAFDDGLQKDRDALEAQLREELKITDVSGLGAEYITDENGYILLNELNHGCTYFVYETGTLPGYNLDTAVYEFTVDADGLIDGKSTYRLKIANQPNQLEVSKMDITGGKELPGATLTIKDSEGNVVETWVSTEEPHRIVGLPAGNYILIEEQAPEGYAIAESITFTLTDSLQVQQVIMYDDLIKIEISKKDITGEEELPGAYLAITDQEGTVVEEWISEEEPHLVNLAVGTYTLTEIAAPEKYATAESVEFTVKDDMSVQHVTMYDAPIQVSVSKKDITGGEELPGAQLTITDQEGAVVEEWISTDTPHMVNLAVGTYTLTEVAAPEKYAKAESIVFEVKDTMEVQQVVMYDKLIEVSISKKDITDDGELPGAQLTITDAEGTVIEEWTSTDTPHMVNLAAGTYTLTEVAAPEKYAKAESIVFEVTDGMEVQPVVMYDKPIEVSISKKDITDDEELPGAQLIVKDKDGATVEEWISTDTPHLMNLAAGSYTLTEVTAPQGYEVAETITFEVTDSMEVQHVTMYDAPKEDTVDLTGKEDTKTTTVGTGSTPYGGGGTTVTSAPVQTGDYNRFAVAILLIIGGMAALTALIAEKKNKKNK
ncbi:SpaA isopeptide-forming pilin-related protein [Ruminococcus sp. 5_1_39BFAA]|uniref:SpaA isopeptide-forming pilin-related protein n=1 Tax=Ruminococcus sp. 5_1_39BFAA TaxID=457412 RepID=UPI0035677FCD